MAESPNELTVDLQASLPEVRIGLTRAGVTGVQKAIRIRHDGHEKTFSAEISCTVDLDPAQKGVHMSRFPEIFGEAIDAGRDRGSVPRRDARRAHRDAHRRAAARIARRGAHRGAVPARAAHAGHGTADAGDRDADRNRGGVARAGPARRRRRGVRASMPARARRGSSAARPASACSRPASPTATSSAFSSSYRSRRTISAAAARCSSAPSRASTPSISSTSSRAR